jgi:hypothetical protein
MLRKVFSVALFCIVAGSFETSSALAAECTTQPTLSFGAIADIQYADVDSPAGGRYFRLSADKLEK